MWSGVGNFDDDLVLCGFESVGVIGKDQNVLVRSPVDDKKSHKLPSDAIKGQDPPTSLEVLE